MKAIPVKSTQLQKSYRPGSSLYKKEPPLPLANKSIEMNLTCVDRTEKFMKPKPGISIFFNNMLADTSSKERINQFHTAITIIKHEKHQH